MSTFLHDFVNQIDEKWSEVDLLISKAKEVQEENQSLYNALCRSVTVLIVAHLEGFTQDLVKSIVHDLNRELSFDQLPTAIKRTYCFNYLGRNFGSNDKKFEQKISKLIDKFDEVNCEISQEPFLSAVNRNPNPEIIHTIFKNFGIEDVFALLHESDLDNVFSDTISVTKAKIEILKNEIKDEILSFPYTFDKSKYNLVKSAYQQNTMWQEFLDQINQKRHLVAHGSEFENLDDAAELEERKAKVVLLQFGLIGILSNVIVSKIR